MLPTVRLPSNTDRMVSSMNCPWLNEGVTMLIRGHGEPSGIVSGSCGLSSVHGQPVLPGGGGGISVTLGQLMAIDTPVSGSARTNGIRTAHKNAGERILHRESPIVASSPATLKHRQRQHL